MNRKLTVFLTDLFYINRLTQYRLCVPLNIGYIGAYANKLFNKEINLHLFKDINLLLEKLKSSKPDVVGLSFYYWNTNLNYYLVKKIREINNDVIIAFGGPSIDNIQGEQEKLLNIFPEVDLFIEGEGELGFSKLIERVLGQGQPNKIFDTPIESSFFRRNGEFVKGINTNNSLPIDEIPSPYLNGSLDEFLKLDYFPLLQATRTCPYLCNFCVAGKDRGKLRSFPMDQIKEEIDYIAKWNKNKPHIILNLAELNFGINKKDPEIAAYLKESSEKVGYPNSVYFYSDKRFTETAKDVITALGTINRDGLIFSLQSDNPETLKNIKRKNLPDEHIEAGIKWAKESNIPVSTEVIFGLPYETYDSMIKLLNKSVNQGFDSILLHNLFIMPGIELNRKEFRDKYGMKTMHRLLGSNYTKVNGDFIAEYEDIVIGNKWFDFQDFLSIRAMNLLFFSVFQGSYYKFFFQFVKENGIPLASFFHNFMNPNTEEEWPKNYLEFVADFKDLACEELHTNLESLYSDAKNIYENNNNDVGEPVRLNPYFFSRLMYSENEWVNTVLKRVFLSMAPDIDDTINSILDRILKLSQQMIVDLRDIEPTGGSLDIEFDLNAWKNDKFHNSIYNFHKNNIELSLELSDPQYQKLKSFRDWNSTLKDKDYYFVAVETILPRFDLFYKIKTL